MGCGFEIALACDLIIASENATFALPEPRVGLAALAGGLHRLPRLIGAPAAMDIMLTGRNLSASAAKALGVVDKIVNEPVGGAHRDYKQAAAFLKRALSDAYRQISDLKVKELLDRRYERLQAYGRFGDTKNR